jgi:hypothetical protein
VLPILPALSKADGVGRVEGSRPPSLFRGTRTQERPNPIQGAKHPKTNVSFGDQIKCHAKSKT